MYLDDPHKDQSLHMTSTCREILKELGDVLDLIKKHTQ